MPISGRWETGSSSSSLWANGKLRLLSRFVPSIKFPDRKPNPKQHNARGMAVRGGIVYLAYDAGGLRLIDVRNKTKPIEIGRYSNPAMNGKPRAYNNVVVEGGLAYVSVDYCGLEVLDVAKPAAIKLVGWWNPWKCNASPWNWFTSPGHTNEIAYDPQCKLLFLASGKSDLQVLSVADPARPEFPGRVRRGREQDRHLGHVASTKPGSISPTSARWGSPSRRAGPG